MAAGRAGVPVPSPLLSARERIVLHQLAEGRTRSEVAAALRVSPSAVDALVQRIVDRLGVRSASGAVARAVREGWE